MNIIFLFWLLFFLAIGIYIHSQKNIHSTTQQKLIIAEDVDLLDAVEEQHKSI
jgi:hypothetical protein